MSVSYTESWTVDVRCKESDFETIKNICEETREKLLKEHRQWYSNFTKKTVKECPEDYPINDSCDNILSSMKKPEKIYKNGDRVIEFDFMGCDGDHGIFPVYLNEICAIPNIAVAAHLNIEDNEYGGPDENYVFWKGRKEEHKDYWDWDFSCPKSAEIPSNERWVSKYVRGDYDGNEEFEAEDYC